MQHLRLLADSRDKEVSSSWRVRSLDSQLTLRTIFLSCLTSLKRAKSQFKRTLLKTLIYREILKKKRKKIRRMKNLSRNPLIELRTLNLPMAVEGKTLSHQETRNQL